MIFVDPDGREIKGVKDTDARKFKKDLSNILSDEKFTNINSLISIGDDGRTFNRIDESDVECALDGFDFNDEELSFVGHLTDAINSDDVHSVEFLSSQDNLSQGGMSALVGYLRTLDENFAEVLASPGFIKGAVVKGLGGTGLNVPITGGSHSFILEGSEILHDGGRAVTSGHEVLGHGPASARGLSLEDNNTRAIQMDNLIRGVMYIGGFRDGSNHGQGVIERNPYLPPSSIR